MPEITVRLRCSVDPDPHSTSGLMFTRWLPLSEDHHFAVQAEGLEFRVWFDEDCVGLGRSLDDLEIERQGNIWFDTICLDVRLPDVSHRLAQFIYEETDRFRGGEDPPETEEYQKLRGQYQDLGKQIQRGATQTLNRIIDYFRVQKGQYRLDRHELDLDNSFAFFFRAQAKVHVEGEWIEWAPFRPMSSGTVRLMSLDRCLAEDGWPDLVAFVRGPRSTPAVLEFLSRAQALAADGYDRSAIVEAVSALETALYAFGRYPDRNQLDTVSKHRTAHRIDFAMLDDLIENRLGLRGSLAYLLPVLLPVDLLPDETLQGCREANAVRVNVVHNAQRSVDENELRNLLSHVRDLSETLLDLTDPPEPPHDVRETGST